MFTIPIAVVISAALVWYWVRLGRSDVPVSRRKIRRFSLVIMLLSLPMFVRALSFVDPAVDKRPYVLAWTACTFMVLVVLATALLDAVNSLRLHQNHRHEALREAAAQLAKALRDRKQEPQRQSVGERAPSAGGAKSADNSPMAQAVRSAMRIAGNGTRDHANEKPVDEQDGGDDNRAHETEPGR